MRTERLEERERERAAPRCPRDRRQRIRRPRLEVRRVQRLPRPNPCLSAGNQARDDRRGEERDQGDASHHRQSVPDRDVPVHSRMSAARHLRRRVHDLPEREIGGGVQRRSRGGVRDIVCSGAPRRWGPLRRRAVAIIRSSRISGGLRVEDDLVAIAVMRRRQCDPTPADGSTVSPTTSMPGRPGHDLV